MTTPIINIASLSFDDIKTSLKTYIKSNTAFTDYDTEGSALSSLLDVFAYNTLFYAYYSNMIANESFLSTANLENNIVSLVKPLGVLVGGKTSSTKSITATTSTSTTFPSYSSAFTDGTYKFYTTKTISLSQTATVFDVYEAETVVKNLPVSVDITDQKVFLGNTNIDINTVRVLVNGIEWIKYNNFETNPGSSALIYFIDRTSSGFYLIFGKRTINDYQSYFGKNIISSDEVLVSYFIPSGSVANNATQLSFAGISILNQTPAVNGTDGVDINLIKYFAPKLFAANDRAVTKDDYYGILLSSNLLPSTYIKDQINVWGGEDSDPPSYGRVFVSFADTTLTKTSSKVISCISYLKTKSMVTVIPEYTIMQPIQIAFNISITNSTDTNSTIKTAIESYYNTIKTFNNTIKNSDIVTIVTSLPNSSDASIIMNNTTISLDVLGSTVPKNVYFKNELFSPTRLTSDGAVITSSSFSYNGATITLKDHATTFNNNDLGINGNLLGYDTTTGISIGILGFVDYISGYVTIKANVLPTGTATTITVIPKILTEIVMKNELVPTVTVTIL